MKINGNILVIGPNAGLLTSLRILLRKHFENIRTTDNIQQAEGLIGIENFDVVLMDLDLFRSKSEAAQTVASIRENNPSLEIVLLSTFAQVPIAAECVNCGAFDFIHKPWNEFEIVISLNNAVTRKGYKVKIAELEKEISLMKSSGENRDLECCDANRSPNRPMTDNYRMTSDGYGTAPDYYGTFPNETLEAIEQRIIKNMMLRNRGNISLTAQQLGITRQTLYNRLKKSSND